MSLFSSSQVDQSQGCETPDKKYKRRKQQEKRRGWDSNPSVPYDTTGLEPAAYRLHGVWRLRWISPLCHPGIKG